MDWLRMPPLAALRAFAAFAETGNVAAAGRALNVSHAAVSQQLRALEAHLGAVLLDRSGRAMSLTADGRHLARALELGFGAIGAAVEELSRDSAARPLQVTLTPAFAMHWLMPRLAGFREAHPDVDLVLDPRGELADPAPGGIDLAIRYGAGRWPGLEAEMLLEAPMVVVAAPGLLDGPVRQPADLLGYPWLQEIGTNEADLWLRDNGVDGSVRTRIALPGNLLLDAARDGQGIAVSVRPFAAADLKAGRLVELFSGRSGGHGYHIATRPGVLRPPARAFAAWLRRQRGS